MATNKEGLVTVKSFAERKGWRINQRDTRVVARRKEGGRRIHFGILRGRPRQRGSCSVMVRTIVAARATISYANSGNVTRKRRLL